MRLWLKAHPLPAARPWGRQSAPAVHLLWARVCGCRYPALSLWRACPAGVAGACPRGIPLTAVRGVWCQALLLPRSLILGAGGRAPLPVYSRRAYCGCGHPSPDPQRALLGAGVARPRDGRRASPGGVPRAVLRSVCGLALIFSLLPVLGADSRGPLSTCCGRECPGVKTRHCLFGVCALRGIARGGAGGRLLQGLTSHRCEGRLVSGAISLPAACPWGGQRGPAARVRLAGVVRVWEPSTGPAARALASQRCALWGWQEGVLGGAGRPAPS